MERGTYIEKIISSKSEMDKLILALKKYTYDSLKKTAHCELSIMEKGVNEDFLRKTFIEFNRIKLISLRKRKSGRENYDFYYLMDDMTYVLYAINITKDPPILINAIHASMNFENFKKSLFKINKDKVV